MSQLYWQENVEPRVWSVLALSSLLVISPWLVAFVVASFTLRALVAPFLGLSLSTRLPAGAGKGLGRVALVSGGKMTKAIEVCRHLKNEGFRVVLLETSKYWMVASRFSNSVDRFVIVPIPEREPEAYFRAVCALAAEEQASLFVPVCSPIASQYDAQLSQLLPPNCISWSMPPDLVRRLDDKVDFVEMAQQAGLPVPDTRRMTSKDSIRKFNKTLMAASPGDTTLSDCYLLKNMQYDPMHRLDLFKLPCSEADLEAYLADITVSSDEPWGVQAFLRGQEYSSSALAWEGKLLAFTDNEASISCFNYKYAGVRAIEDWAAKFCKNYNVSGVICLDFIIGADCVPRAIECNPRFSSNITTFYNHPGLGAVLADPAAALESQTSSGTGTLRPMPTAQEVNWTCVDLYYIAARHLPYAPVTALQEILAVLFHKKDAYWALEDPLPQLALHTLHFPVLLLRNLVNGNRWAKLDFCIGKITEVNGD